MPTRPVHEGLFTDSHLIGGRCAACGRYHFPAAVICPYCGAGEVARVVERDAVVEPDREGHGLVCVVLKPGLVEVDRAQGLAQPLQLDRIAEQLADALLLGARAGGGLVEDLGGDLEIGGRTLGLAGHGVLSTQQMRTPAAVRRAGATALFDSAVDRSLIRSG